ncbi:MAG: hypothetical protein AB7F59_05575 [Bdellovibrionales bacterium]
MSKTPPTNVLEATSGAPESMIIEKEMVHAEASLYELLKREGELHFGRPAILEELRGNLTRLEDLHGKLQYMLGEVETLLRR